MNQFISENMPWLDLDYPTMETYDRSLFQIQGTTLKHYSGDETVVKIPYGVKQIGDFVFSYKTAERIIIPDSVQKIETDAFRSCKMLQKVILPKSLEKIGATAFAGCSLLKEIRIPEGVAYVSTGAFLGCESVREVYIPASLINIADGVFGGCRALRKIAVAPDNKRYYAKGKCLLEKDWNALAAGCNRSVIPEGVPYIMDAAFIGCDLIKTLDIPGSVLKIGSNAFFLCSALETVTIPENVMAIGRNAFRQCPKLTIYCEAAEKPALWDEDWNPDGRPVIWGVKK